MKFTNKNYQVCETLETPPDIFKILHPYIECAPTQPQDRICQDKYVSAFRASQPSQISHPSQTQSCALQKQDHDMNSLTNNNQDWKNNYAVLQKNHEIQVCRLQCQIQQKNDYISELKQKIKLTEGLFVLQGINAKFASPVQSICQQIIKIKEQDKTQDNPDAQMIKFSKMKQKIEELEISKSYCDKKQQQLFVENIKLAKQLFSYKQKEAVQSLQKSVNTEQIDENDQHSLKHSQNTSIVSLQNKIIQMMQIDVKLNQQFNKKQSNAFETTHPTHFDKSSFFNMTQQQRKSGHSSKLSFDEKLTYQDSNPENLNNNYSISCNLNTTTKALSHSNKSLQSSDYKWRQLLASLQQLKKQNKALRDIMGMP